MVSMSFQSSLARPAQDSKAVAATSADLGYDCEVVRDLRGLEALASAWDDLHTRCGRGAHVFQSFNWNWHWARHFLSGPDCNVELAVVCLRKTGALVGLWPLCVVRHPGLRVIHWMGEPVSQYGDVLLDPAHAAAGAMAYGWARAITLLQADALHIRKVRADATTLPWLQTHRAHVTQREEAPYLDFTGTSDFDTYEERYSSKSRKNRRRLFRRLQGMGEVRFEHLVSGPQAREAALEAIVLKRRTLDETGRLSMALHDPRFAAFFADAAEAASHPCGCRVTRMTVDGRHVASSIDINFRGHRAAHIIVHEPEFAACGPGLHMVEDWARTAHAEGMTQLDLLAPAHSYKWDWADSSIAVNDYALATSLKGRVFVGYLAHVRPGLKAMAERVAQWQCQRRKAQCGSAEATAARPADGQGRP